MTEAAFLLGLEDPVLGPSALEAIAYGAVYINPTTAPKLVSGQHLKSQHPYAEEQIGMPHVCSCALQDSAALDKCIRHALVRAGQPVSADDADLSQTKSTTSKRLGSNAAAGEGDEELSFVPADMSEASVCARVLAAFSATSSRDLSRQS